MPFPVRMLSTIGGLIAVCATITAAQPAKGKIRVEISDSSGGRLPGVAVTATSADGQVLLAVTDRSGGALFPAVSTGPVMLRFRLEGFAGVLVGVTVESGVETRVEQRLEVAPVLETVV